MIRKLSISAIKFYQRNLRFLFSPSCRFVPSCSNYAIEALGKLSFFKALGKILLRVARCNPFSCGGHDPVK